MTKTQSDKIKGLFYGQAIGDALGLGTEFLSKKDISIHYPDGLSDYAQIIQDKHRSRWKMGDWTDDTDQFLCICRSILRSKKVDEFAFAEELYGWFKGNPMGIGNTVYKVVSMPQFTLYPHKAAELVWKISGGKNAANGAIMRTSILGTYHFWDDDQVQRNTEKIARVTHWDPRCVGSCVVVTRLIASILAERKFMDVAQLCHIADEYDDSIREYIENAYSLPIEHLNLDEPTAVGYTLKALSAGLWAYFHASDFEAGVLKVINEGGDADTNACVAGSILGAKFGYNAIPKKYIDGLRNKEQLEEIFGEYIALLNEKYSISK
ncbi:MAG: ADP-ribosylglycohydrolase family protein [Chitinophagales bacterium]|nr:ADP-ribosylglycohydrolase family protein [Chitinophagales bacterium]